LVIANIFQAHATKQKNDKPVLPNFMVRDERFLKEVIVRGCETLTRMREPKDASSIQSSWEGFKKWILKEGRTQGARGFHNTLKGKQRNLELVRAKVLQQPDPDSLEIHEINRKLADLANEARARDSIKGKTSDHLLGGRTGKYLSRQTKKKVHRNTIQALKRTGSSPTLYTTDPGEMVEIFKSYYENLQEDATQLDEDDLNTKLLDLLKDSPLPHMKPEAASALEADFRKDEVRTALSGAKKSAAPGRDGITFELWNTLMLREEVSRKSGKEGFDIVEALTILFNDIKKNGLIAGANFTEGWLCPIPKKGDIRDPKNYRPITCLNTDYKLLTKLLSLRLARSIDEIVSEAQAGFVPGRQILQQTDLV
jgi:hypothetical protein